MAEAAALRRRLLAWWDAGHRDLPWRFPQLGADPYRVWLAEVMLQQTRVEAVVPYYHRFVARWPTLERLAAAREAEVLAAWSGLGYYARGRNLLTAAREAWRHHGGLPASLEDLRSLPGFGPYTAGAVASIAFALPAAAVDGNVARVLARLHAVPGPAQDPRHRRRLWALARALVGEGGPARSACPRPGDLNQALMELGATVCGRSPDCGRCPVAGLCQARKAGLERRIPPPRRRAARRPLTLACAVVGRGGRLLLARRPERGLFAGLLCFPCAEVEEGAPPGRALAAALRSLGVKCRPGHELARVDRLLTHRALRLIALDCGGVVEVPTAPGRLRWVARRALGRAGLPAAMRALAEALSTKWPRQSGRA